MAAYHLNPVQFWGRQSGLEPPFVFLNPTTVVYPSTYHLVFEDVEKGSQRLLALAGKRAHPEPIMAWRCAHNRQLVAVAQYVLRPDPADADTAEADAATRGGVKMTPALYRETGVWTPFTAYVRGTTKIHISIFDVYTARLVRLMVANWPTSELTTRGSFRLQFSTDDAFLAMYSPKRVVLSQWDVRNIRSFYQDDVGRALALWSHVDDEPAYRPIPVGAQASRDGSSTDANATTNATSTSIPLSHEGPASSTSGKSRTHPGAPGPLSGLPPLLEEDADAEQVPPSEEGAATSMAASNPALSIGTAVMTPTAEPAATSAPSSLSLGKSPSTPPNDHRTVVDIRGHYIYHHLMIVTLSDGAFELWNSSANQQFSRRPLFNPHQWLHPAPPVPPTTGHPKHRPRSRTLGGAAGAAPPAAASLTTPAAEKDPKTPTASRSRRHSHAAPWPPPPPPGTTGQPTDADGLSPPKHTDYTCAWLNHETFVVGWNDTLLLFHRLLEGAADTALTPQLVRIANVRIAALQLCVKDRQVLIVVGADAVIGSSVAYNLRFVFPPESAAPDGLLVIGPVSLGLIPYDVETAWVPDPQSPEEKLIEQTTRTPTILAWDMAAHHHIALTRDGLFLLQNGMLLPQEEEPEGGLTRTRHLALRPAGQLVHVAALAPDTTSWAHVSPFPLSQSLARPSPVVDIAAGIKKPITVLLTQRFDLLIVNTETGHVFRQALGTLPPYPSLLPADGPAGVDGRQADATTAAAITDAALAAADEPLPAAPALLGGPTTTLLVAPANQPRSLSLSPDGSQILVAGSEKLLLGSLCASVQARVRPRLDDAAPASDAGTEGDPDAEPGTAPAAAAARASAAFARKGSLGTELYGCRWRDVGVRNPRCVRFSEGGHLFAVAVNNRIEVYNVWTLELVQTLHGHGGKVLHVAWAVYDTMLLSTASEGSVYAWNIKTGARVNENVMKGSKYRQILRSDFLGHHWWTLTDDTGLLRVMVDGQVVAQYSQLQIGCVGFVDLPATAAAEAAAKASAAERDATYQPVERAVWGLQDGSITNPDVKKLTTPGAVSTRDVDFRQDCLPLFSRACRHVVVSGNKQQLVVVDEAGCLALVAISIPKSDIMTLGLGKKMVLYSDDIQTSRTDWDMITQQAHEYRTTLNEMGMNFDYQLRLLDMEFDQKVKAITMEKSGLLEAQKIYHANLEHEVDQAREKRDAEQDVIRAGYQRERLALEEAFAAKYMEQVEVTMQYERELKKKIEATEVEQIAWRRASETILRRTTEEYESKIKQLMKACEEARDLLQTSAKDAIGERDEHHLEVDVRLAALTEGFEQAVKAEFEIKAHLKGEQALMNKKEIGIIRHLHEVQAEVQAAFARYQEHEARKNALEKMCADELALIADRDNEIAQQEARLMDEKRAHQVLEKEKYILDYRLKEMSEQIAPREAKIKAMVNHVGELSQTLSEMAEQDAETHKHMEGVQAELAREKTLYAHVHSKRRALEHQWAAMQSAITLRADTFTDTQRAVETVVDLVQQYVPDMLEEVPHAAPAAEGAAGPHRDSLATLASAASSGTVVLPSRGAVYRVKPVPRAEEHPTTCDCLGCQDRRVREQLELETDHLARLAQQLEHTRAAERKTFEAERLVANEKNMGLLQELRALRADVAAVKQRARRIESEVRVTGLTRQRLARDTAAQVSRAALRPRLVDTASPLEGEPDPASLSLHSPPARSASSAPASGAALALARPTAGSPVTLPTLAPLATAPIVRAARAARSLATDGTTRSTVSKSALRRPAHGSTIAHPLTGDDRASPLLSLSAPRRGVHAAAATTTWPSLGVANGTGSGTPASPAPATVTTTVTANGAPSGDLGHGAVGSPRAMLPPLASGMGRPVRIPRH
ncbi:hypothetical protein CXG81DRAFT_25342 [Caulochytrium protostelioides]|uniref:Uncharacterized protein n=1 Tax=Caulochytrium protostelioides TaxID=1555241 RepID=A0A4P9XA64_9FUNG|nr:hypothetical protein CXG81DRAFT_25342 [Caulochytrium protostelioides]|eukprot:RKP01990.1 hypothetical protein CXG81DRAFT_25342 [Caulochytrium protostelioides]